jgi:hypothetical protein
MALTDDLEEMDRIRKESGSSAPAPSLKDAVAEMDAIRAEKKKIDAAGGPKLVQPPPGIRATLSGAIAPVLGGLRGLGEIGGRLASGDSLSSAVEQAGSAANETRDRLTYKDAPIEEMQQNKFLGNRSPYAQYSPAVVVPKAAAAAGNATADATGSPALGAWVDTAVQAAPGLIIPGKTGAAVGLRAPIGIPADAASIAGRSVADRFPISGKRLGPYPEAPVAAAQTSPVNGAAADTAVGVGAARANNNPYPALSGEVSARGGPYPVVKLSDIPDNVAHSEQAIRSKIASEIVPASTGVREGVVTGNENMLRNEHTEANQANRTPRGDILKKQIADEQRALSEYAEKRIENTGASPTLVNDYQRGERINNAFAGDDGLRGFIKDQKKSIYDEARATVGDNSVPAGHLESLLADPQFKAEMKLRGTQDFTHGLADLYEHHKNMGFEVSGDKMSPNSIAGLDELRKSVNRGWTPDNAYATRRAVQAIDNDIAAAGGPGLYEKGRGLHQFEQQIFEPAGIKKLFGDINPITGTQTATPFDNIPKKLNNMTFDEWRHVYDTADMMSKRKIRFRDHEIDIPPELQQAAESAKAEIAGNVAREVHEAASGKAGAFNQNSLNKTLNARAQKIEHAFPPEEQQAFHTLNYGAQIMPGVHSYEGAALQGQRLGLIGNKLPTIGREIGAATHIPGAATLLEKGGEKVQGALLSGKMGREAKALQQKLQQNRNLGKEGPYNEDMRRLP